MQPGLSSRDIPSKRDLSANMPYYIMSISNIDAGFFLRASQCIGA